MVSKEVFEPTNEEIENTLKTLLDDLLERGNQEGSFKVLSLDMEREKLIVEFDITIVEEDKYIGFQGY